MREELAEMFAEIKSDLGELSAKITLADGSEYDVIAPSIGLARSNSEQGQSYDPIATLYIPAAADVDAKLWFGGIVKVLYRGRESDWRIETVHNQAGLLRIDLKALHG